MTDVNVAAFQVAPIGGAMNDGTRLVFVPVTAKAAQNDTIIITNCNSVLWASLHIVASGAHETYTISGKTITLTSGTTGDVEGVVLVK
jgi:hypothetical protein